MFERFEPPSRSVMAEARLVALRFRHDWIGVEHILYALTTVDDGRVFGDRDLVERVRGELDRRVARGPASVGETRQLPFTPEAKRALEHTLEIFREEKSAARIGTRHLVLGIARVRRSIAGRILDEAGVRPERLPLPDSTAEGVTTMDAPEHDAEDTAQNAADPDIDAHHEDRELPIDSWGRDVVKSARAEARRYGHDYVGTEHLLLGITLQRNSVAAHVLRNMNVDLKDVRRAIEDLMTSPAAASRQGPAEIPWSPKAMLALDAAIDEAERLGQDYVGSEHILLAILTIEDSMAGAILRERDIDPEGARKEVIEFLGGTFDEDDESGKRAQHGRRRDGSARPPLSEAALRRRVRAYRIAFWIVVAALIGLAWWVS